MAAPPRGRVDSRDDDQYADPAREPSHRMADPRQFPHGHRRPPRARRGRGPGGQRVHLGGSLHAGPDERGTLLHPAVRARRDHDRRGRGPRGGVPIGRPPRRRGGPAQRRLARRRPGRRPAVPRGAGDGRGADLGVPRRPGDHGPQRLRRTAAHRPVPGRRERVRLRRGRVGRFGGGADRHADGRLEGRRLGRQPGEGGHVRRALRVRRGDQLQGRPGPEAPARALRQRERRGDRRLLRQRGR